MNERHCPFCGSLGKPEPCCPAQARIAELQRELHNQKNIARIETQRGDRQQELRGQAEAARDAARAALAACEARAERLRRHAKHSTDCGVWSTRTDGAEGACTCGLAEAIAQGAG